MKIYNNIHINRDSISINTDIYPLLTITRNKSLAALLTLTPPNEYLSVLSKMFTYYNKLAIKQRCIKHKGCRDVQCHRNAQDSIYKSYTSILHNIRQLQLQISCQRRLKWKKKNIFVISVVIKCPTTNRK